MHLTFDTFDMNYIKIQHAAVMMKCVLAEHIPQWAQQELHNCDQVLTAEFPLALRG